jgi:hypothetical protein
VAALGLALGIVGLASGRTADVVLAHLHNAFAIGVWWTLRERRSRFEILVPATILGGLAACASLGPMLTSHGATFGNFGAFLSLDTLLDSLAPPAIAERAGLAWVLVFAFGQSVHYAIWLRLIPEDARRRDAPRSFASSYRALRSELGTAMLLIALGTCALVVSWAAIDLAAARDGYLRLALFHGPLEIGLASLAYSEARRM